MEEVTVTAIRIIDSAKPYADDSRLLAEFDARFAGMTVRGLQLVRTARGGFKTVSPAVTRSCGREAIRFTDPAVMHAVSDAARRLYLNMGGQYGAYAGQE